MPCENLKICSIIFLTAVRFPSASTELATIVYTPLDANNMSLVGVKIGPNSSKRTRLESSIQPPKRQRVSVGNGGFVAPAVIVMINRGI